MKKALFGQNPLPFYTLAFLFVYVALVTPYSEEAHLAKNNHRRVAESDFLSTAPLNVIERPIPSGIQPLLMDNTGFHLVIDADQNRVGNLGITCPSPNTLNFDYTLQQNGFPTNWNLQQTHLWLSSTSEVPPSNPACAPFIHPSPQPFTDSFSNIDVTQYLDEENCLNVFAHADLSRDLGQLADLNAIGESPAGCCHPFQVSSSSPMDQSYFNIDVGGQNLNGWCLDALNPIRMDTRLCGQLISSYDPSLQRAGIIGQPQNLDLANYVINNVDRYLTFSDVVGTCTWQSIQRALWRIVDIDRTLEGSSEFCVQQIVMDAEANGRGFIPSCPGGKYLMLIVPTSPLPSVTRMPADVEYVRPTVDVYTPVRPTVDVYTPVVSDVDASASVVLPVVDTSAQAEIIITEPTPIQVVYETPTPIPVVYETPAPVVLPFAAPAVPIQTFPLFIPTPETTFLPSFVPTLVPSTFQTLVPSSRPTLVSSTVPVLHASSVPTFVPSTRPTFVPSTVPTSTIVHLPTTSPSTQQIFVPSVVPTTIPSTLPTSIPGSEQILVPSTVPTVVASTLPTGVPTVVPSVFPTTFPTVVPSVFPTTVPTTIPTVFPTTVPTSVPSAAPTTAPTTVPSVFPTTVPTFVQSTFPTTVPSTRPIDIPSTIPTLVPSSFQTTVPSTQPINVPSTIPTTIPSTFATTIPSSVPILVPSSFPTLVPSTLPTLVPSSSITLVPSLVPTLVPSLIPTLVPSLLPTPVTTLLPSLVPLSVATSIPTLVPSTIPTFVPSFAPTLVPSIVPPPVVRPLAAPPVQIVRPTPKPQGVIVDFALSTALGREQGKKHHRQAGIIDEGIHRRQLLPTGTTTCTRQPIQVVAVVMELTSDHCQRFRQFNNAWGVPAGQRGMPIPPQATCPAFNGMGGMADSFNATVATPSPTPITGTGTRQAGGAFVEEAQAQPVYFRLCLPSQCLAEGAPTEEMPFEPTFEEPTEEMPFEPTFEEPTEETPFEGIGETAEDAEGAGGAGAEGAGGAGAWGTGSEAVPIPFPAEG